MARFPYAAEQLIAQAQEKFKTANATPDDEPDGIGVHRAFRFDAKSSKWLHPLLDVIAPSDPRIVGSELLGGQRLVVTFSGGIEADDRAPFPLVEVEAVLKDD